MNHGEKSATITPRVLSSGRQPRTTSWWPVLACPLLLCLLLVGNEVLRPQLLLVGNVTIDVVDGKRVAGGAVTYAAVVAAAHGIRACVVTAAAPDADVSAFKGHQLHIIPADHTLTFEHTYTWWGNRRKLRVTAQPNVTLAPDHVPWYCKRARAVMLGPLTQADVDAPAFFSKPLSQGTWGSQFLRQPYLGLMAQGMQRTLEQGSGKVMSLKLPSQELQDCLHPGVSVFLSDVETDPWSDGTLEALSLRCQRFLVTRGEQGADEYRNGSRIHHPAFKVEAALDTNGAGDTFATAWMIAETWGHPKPGAHANWAGSRAVLQQQVCKPLCTGEEIRAQYGLWIWQHIMPLWLQLRRFL